MRRKLHGSQDSHFELRAVLPNGSRRYLAPAFAANRKVKPLTAIVQGKEVVFASGCYFLRYAKAGDRGHYESTGSDPQQALLAKLKREMIPGVQDLGVHIQEQERAAPKSQQAGLVLRDPSSLQRFELHRLRKTFATMHHEKWGAGSAHPKVAAAFVLAPLHYQSTTVPSSSTAVAECIISCRNGCFAASASFTSTPNPGSSGICQYP